MGTKIHIWGQGSPLGTICKAVMQQAKWHHFKIRSNLYQMQPLCSFAPAGAQRKGNPAGCWTQRVPAVALSSKCRSSQGRENIPQVLRLRLSQLHALGWRLVCSQCCRNGGKNPPQRAHVLQLLLKKRAQSKARGKGQVASSPRELLPEKSRCRVQTADPERQARALHIFLGRSPSNKGPEFRSFSLKQVGNLERANFSSCA